MKLLLDTATLLWISHDAAKLSPVARAAYLDPANELYVSVASLWEIIVKHRLGKLPLPAPVEKLIEPLRASGTLRIVSLSERAVYQLQTLPNHHRDPFDRMLICQAIDDGFTIVTPDAEIALYSVTVLW
jgi:PIN domain nuclease of toxin-antitoxin system